MPLELAQLPDLDDYQAGDPEQLLTAAESAVRAYCGWHIAPSRTDTITTTIPFTGRMFLPSMYVTTIVSVTEDAVVLDTPNYVFHENGWLDRMLPYVPLTWGQASQTTVVFTHGYFDVPPDIQQVVLALANRNVNTPGNLTRVGQVQYASGVDAFTEAEKVTLRRYRIPALP